MKTCLIVEDSTLIREIAARIVGDMGLAAKAAIGSEEAMAICREERPDVILLDWDLPDLGALDFLRALSELGVEARPPVIITATEYDPEQFALAKAVGAAWHIMKPFDLRAVAEKFIEIGIIAQIPGASRDRAAS